MNRSPRVPWALIACAAAFLLLPGASRPQAPAAPANAPAATGVYAPPAGSDPQFLEQYTATLRFTLGTPQAIQVVPGGRAVLFLRSGPRSFVRDLYELDPQTGDERLLASAAQLLGGGEERLSAEEKARRERARLAARGEEAAPRARPPRRPRHRVLRPAGRRRARPGAALRPPVRDRALDRRRPRAAGRRRLPPRSPLVA